MTEARAGDQVVRYDREATAAIYAGLKHGFAEECGCVFCRNFAAQRDPIGGWFYFVGEMAAWGERNVNAPDADRYFDFFFTSASPPAPAFRGRALPVLPEPPEYRTASKDTRPR
ncbi:MAG: hypothetical protein P4L56_11115 [Candidatus Sulfopaludibacter sp.]|nr:hypothetical protein [Candidatus Sulfopaludibacter sp.]